MTSFSNTPYVYPSCVPTRWVSSPVHALLLACMHRATHKQTPLLCRIVVAYYSANRLIWLYDIHLLAKSLSYPQWHDVVRLARDKGLRATCLDGIERAGTCFHTSCPDFVLAGSGRIRRQGARSNLPEREQAASTVDGFSCARGVLQPAAVPPGALLPVPRPTCAPNIRRLQPGWLPMLYARRALGGLAKRLKTRQQPS